MKKIKYLLSVIILMLLVLVGCAQNEEKSSDKTQIDFLIGKNEIVKQLDSAIVDYNKSQDEYEVKMVHLGSANFNEKMATLYSSGNAPTLINMGTGVEMMQWKDKLTDLSDLSFIDKIDPEFLRTSTIDEKLYGVPFTLEAYGYIYNKDVLDEAYSGNFDAKSIKTRDDLEGMFKKIEGIGKKAIEISPMDWSLGMHFTNVLFANQGETTEERQTFLNDLADEKIELKDNKVYQDWLATFDLMKKYNSAKKSPLATEYDTTVLNMADGEIGAWFMGNWVIPQLEEANPDGNYGFLPVPISNDESFPGNSKLSVGVPHTLAVDRESSSEEQIAGAKDFIEWLYTTEQGQDYYVNQFNFIPISTDLITLKPADSLSLDIMDFSEDNETLEWMNAYYPIDATNKMGVSIQKYLSDEITADEFTAELENYWATSK